MADAMLCAECGIPVPATVLIVHPHLYQMAIPACGLHGELLGDADLDVVPLDSPDGAEVLRTHTVLSGFYVPRPQR